jgi:hypothetical protein
MAECVCATILRGSCGSVIWGRCNVRSVDCPRSEAMQCAMQCVFVLIGHRWQRWIALAVVMPCCGECTRDMVGEELMTRQGIPISYDRAYTTILGTPQMSPSAIGPLGAEGCLLYMRNFHNLVSGARLRILASCKSGVVILICARNRFFNPSTPKPYSFWSSHGQYQFFHHVNKSANKSWGPVAYSKLLTN